MRIRMKLKDETLVLIFFENNTSSAYQKLREHTKDDCLLKILQKTYTADVHNRITVKYMVSQLKDWSQPCGLTGLKTWNP